MAGKFYLGKIIKIMPEAIIVTSVHLQHIAFEIFYTL
jgi:hypothetical protein